MITGETLRLLRLIKGLKQKTMADNLNMSQPAYSKMEKRKKINGAIEESIKKILCCTESEIEVIKKILPPPPPINKKFLLL